MISRKLNPIFGEKHQNYINRAKTATISVAEGAVRAGKTIDNIAAFAWFIQNGTPDRIHLATGSTAANAKLNIGDANGFGLEHIFRGRCRWTKYRGNEALAIKSKGREYIVIFAGGGKADSYKKIRGNSYGMWIATEINLHHENTIKEAFNRQLAARVRRIFWDLNPGNPGAWIYTSYIDCFEDQFGSGYNYEHFTIRDNLTISTQRLAEIERQYDPTSVWYKRDILGQRCPAEGIIYPMFNAVRNIDNAVHQGQYYISCDYGIKNPFSAHLWCVESGIAYCLDEYYYDGRKTAPRTDEEHYTAIEKLVGSRQLEHIVIDPSASSMIETIYRHGRFAVRKANNDVVGGIGAVSTLLQSGRLKYNEKCVNNIKEFGLYSWDMDAAEDKPIKENDHAMDDNRYFVSTVLIDELEWVDWSRKV